jgi:hypothetical protein
VSDENRVTNIGPAQRSTRRRAGIIGLCVGTALVLVAWLAGLGVWVRVLAAPLFFGGFSGIFQARAKT